MYDLLIVGGGPAAFSAMAYALSKQLSCAMVYADMGGKTSQPAPEGGEGTAGYAHLSTEQVEHMHELRVRAEQERLLPLHEAMRVLVRESLAHPERLLHDHVRSLASDEGIFRVTTEQHGVLKSRAVLIATGARPVLLDVPGARRLARVGLVYSPTTYAHLAADQRVAVIGAGERALRGAAELTRTARQVYLIPMLPELPNTPLARALLVHPDVVVLAGYSVTELLGEETLEAMILTHGAQTCRLPVERAFVDLGLVAQSGFLKGLVPLDERGRVVVDERGATCLPGLYAAGDVSTNVGEQILVAIGDGARAAMSAYDYLLGRWLLAS